jgi:hypothetical protein
MDVDNAEIQTAHNYPSPQLREERQQKGQCMQCGQMGHIMKNCPRGYPLKWNKNPGNTQCPIRQLSPSQTRNWASQSNHMPRQSSRPPQYTQNRNLTCGAGQGYSNIVDDQSPIQTLLQIHPTTNPGEAKQVMDGMMQDQPTCWRDINRQDFS